MNNLQDLNKISYLLEECLYKVRRANCKRRGGLNIVHWFLCIIAASNAQSTRKHFNRMCTTRLKTVRASVSVAKERGDPLQTWCRDGGLYTVSEVQYIGNGHMGTPLWTDRYTLYDCGCEYYSGNKRFLNIVKTTFAAVAFHYSHRIRSELQPDTNGSNLTGKNLGFMLMRWWHGIVT